MFLLAAAWRDFAAREIPNGISIAVAVTGVMAQAMIGPMALAIGLGLAIVVFAALMIPFSRGMLGGGDVKLAAALAIGLAPLDVWAFITATAAFGGVLALVYIALWRGLPNRIAGPDRTRPVWRRIVAAELHRIRRHGPMPYGIAIAGGGTFVLLSPGYFMSAFNSVGVLP